MVKVYAIGLLCSLSMVTACSETESLRKASAQKLNAKQNLNDEAMPPLAKGTESLPAEEIPNNKEIPDNTLPSNNDDEEGKYTDVVIPGTPGQHPHQSPGQHPGKPLPPPPLEMPSSVAIKNITYNGTGCPNGRNIVDVSGDGMAFTVVYTQFVANAGSKHHGYEDVKNCMLNLEIDVPQGWQYTLISVDQRGYADVGCNSEASLKTDYFLSDESKMVSFEHKIPGEYKGEFTKSQDIALETQVWSSCEHADANLKINTTLTAKAAPNSHALIGLDSTDGELTQKFALQWKKCAN